MKYLLEFGTSANPIQQGHVDLVIQGVRALAARGYEIERVVVVPTYRRNPTGGKVKDDLPATFEERMAVSREAAREIERGLVDLGVLVEVSRIDEELVAGTEGRNYTVETVAALRAAQPGKGTIVLLSSELVSGDDPELGHWHDVDRLLDLALIAIGPRRGYPPNRPFLESLAERGGTVVYLDEIDVVDISSTEVRRRLASGDNPCDLSDQGLLPESVAAYLARNNRYAGREPGG